MQADYNELTECGNTGESHDCMRLVASRRRALELLRSAAAAIPQRPVLISGETGAGKASLIHRFTAKAPSDWCVASVDLAAEMNALDFLRLAGHPLGVSVSSRLGKARIRLENGLADEHTEGRRWLLVVKEAQRGRRGVWDEVQALANQLGRPHGFASIFLVGSTKLARSLVARPSSRGLAALGQHISISNRLTWTKHELLDARAAMGSIDEHTLEDLHRKSHGNPALLLPWRKHGQIGGDRKRWWAGVTRSYSILT